MFWLKLTSKIISADAADVASTEKMLMNEPSAVFRAIEEKSLKSQS